jgi:hypothetical protein
MSIMSRCSVGIVLHCGHHAIGLGCLVMVSYTVRTWCRGSMFEPPCCGRSVPRVALSHNHIRAACNIMNLDLATYEHVY